jgi:hypothetical protein
MKCVSFLGTPYFPNQPFSNKKFCNIVKISLVIICALGITLASLSGSGVVTRDFILKGCCITGVSITLLLALKIFNPNWLKKEMNRLITETNLLGLKTLIFQMHTHISPSVLCCCPCDDIKPDVFYTSYTLSGNVTAWSLENKFNKMVRNFKKTHTDDINQLNQQINLIQSHLGEDYGSPILTNFN